MQKIRRCGNDRQYQPAWLEAYENLKTSAEHAFERYEARQFSRAAIENLSPWIEKTWLDQRRAEVDADASSTGPISLVADGLPALPAYQRFRIRASRIGEKAMQVFEVLRSKEALLSEIPDDELETETRRIIAREARLAWKARIETEHPALLYETGEIQSKVRALAEADSAMRRAWAALQRGVFEAGTRPAAFERSLRQAAVRNDDRVQHPEARSRAAINFVGIEVSRRS